MIDDTVKKEPQIDQPSSKNVASNAPEVLEEISKVGTSPKRNMLILFGMSAVLGVVIYNLLIPQIFPPTPEVIPTPQNVSSPSPVVQDVPTVPQLPEPPKLVDPTPPPPPIVTPPVPPVTEHVTTPAADVALPPATPLPSAQLPSRAIPQGLPSEVISEKSEDTKKRQESKRKSAIVLVAGKEDTKTAIEKEQLYDFTKRGDLEYVLGQGKIIDAVIENAVNTDNGGEVRAVISRDVYSENAKVILIPRGSKIFGAYTSSVSNSSARISITWNKINLESGYTLNIKADAVDHLGRKGIEGRLDRKYAEQMTNAVLASAFNIAVATGLDKLVPPVTSTATAAQTSSGITSLIGLATNIATDTKTYPTPQAQITAICTQGPASITDTTSSAYVELIKICANANAVLPTAGANAPLVVSQLVSQISGLATTSAVAAASAATPTQVQQASKDAFTNISSAAKTMLDQTTFKPTITLDQGTQVKIYVTKDYVFPKGAINKSKVLQ